MQSRLAGEPVDTLLILLGEMAPDEECVVVVEYTTQVTMTATGRMLMVVPYEVFPTRARGISPVLSIPASMTFDVLMRVPGGITGVVVYHYDMAHCLAESEEVVRCECVVNGKPLTRDFEVEVTPTQLLRTHENDGKEEEDGREVDNGYFNASLLETDNGYLGENTLVVEAGNVYVDELVFDHYGYIAFNGAVDKSYRELLASRSLSGHDLESGTRGVPTPWKVVFPPRG